MRILLASLCLSLCTAALLAQPPAPNGRATFERLCARCHGGDGRGGELGPGIVARLGLRSDDELSAIVRDGIPAKGMPGLAMADDERRALLTFLRTLRPGATRHRCACERSSPPVTWSAASR